MNWTTIWRCTALLIAAAAIIYGLIQMAHGYR